jgi:leucyl-tRNA synthetase
MMMMGLHFIDKVPFHTVYIHALVRDEKGQKMSKSKGNIIDPLELIDKFGAGDVKERLTTNGQGRDTRDFVVQKFLRKVVLFTNTFVRPTIGPIEFGDDRFVVFHAYLIYPIFVTVECGKRSVGAIA